MENIKKCPKCSGAGKVAFTVDGGVCYKCEGSGFIGGSEDEIAKAISERELRNAIPASVKSIVKHISSNQAATLEDMAINLNGQKKEYVLGTKIADLFSTPFVDNYEYIFTCGNPSKWMLNNREVLNGKFSIIEKITENKIRITINTTN